MCFCKSVRLYFGTNVKILLRNIKGVFLKGGEDIYSKPQEWDFSRSLNMRFRKERKHVFMQKIEDVYVKGGEDMYSKGQECVFRRT